MGAVTGGWALIFVSLFIIYTSRILKSIFVTNNSIISKGFRSEDQFPKNNLERIVYLGVIQVYYLKMKSGKKVFFLGTNEDYRNASSDWFDSGKKEIMERINN